MKRERPAIVIGTGGFVSVPVVIAAALLRIPIVVHEQTIIPGLANRIAARFATKVLISYEETRRFFDSSKVITVGNPLRKELKHGLPSRDEAVRRLGFTANIPVLYVTGGANGADSLNEVVCSSLPQLVQQWQVVHQCGAAPVRFSFQRLAQEAEKLPPALRTRYRLTRYVSTEVGDVFAVADVILSRSGAAIVNEIVQLGIPAVLVPYPQSAGGEQLVLARLLEQRGAAVLIEEGRLTPDVLLAALRAMTPGARLEMRTQALSLAAAAVEERLVKIIGDTISTARTLPSP